MIIAKSVIQANSRARFTAADFDFIVRTLSTSSSSRVSLVQLLTDHETLNQLLDHELLIHAILSSTEQLTISPQFYFYILTRRALKQSGIEDRKVCDYISSLLEQFLQTARLRPPVIYNASQAHLQNDDVDVKVVYLADLLIALQNASPEQAFLLRTHIGNYSLFLTGIFHENIECRSRRKGAPDCVYYEELGRSNYRVVASHAVAKKCELTEVYNHLAEQFRSVRFALNHLANDLLNLDDRE